MKSLDTKLAIVTGAARGIGFATAQLFKQNGYRVALIDKDKEELNNLSTNNVNEKKFCFDISDSTQLDNMYEEILNQELVNGMPEEVVVSAKKKFTERLDKINWNDYYKSWPFNESALALYEWAPIAEELKALDRKIVLNSMILKWDNIKDEFSKLIKI